VAGKGKSGKPSADDIATAQRVLAHFTKKNGVQYQASEAHVRLIRSRLAEGLTEHDLRCVVGFAWDALGLGWQSAVDSNGTPMARHLVPETLFGPQKIHKYLEPARAWYREHVLPGLERVAITGRGGSNGVNGSHGAHVAHGSTLLSRLIPNPRKA
jgi:uncharacterized phage protein (TIGR02220 family)